MKTKLRHLLVIGLIFSSLLALAEDASLQPSSVTRPRPARVPTLCEQILGRTPFSSKAKTVVNAWKQDLAAWDDPVRVQAAAVAQQRTMAGQPDHLNIPLPDYEKTANMQTDLRIDLALPEVLKEFLHTPFGELRWKYYLSEGFPDAESLRQHHEAVRFLLANPELRKQVKEQLAQVETMLTQSGLAQLLERPPTFDRRAWYHNTLSTLAGSSKLGGWGLSGISAITHNIWFSLLSLVIGNGASYLLSLNGSFNATARTELRRFEPFMRLAKNLAPAMREATPSTLGNIGMVFSGVSDEDLAPELYQVAHCYDTMLNSWVQKGFDLLRINYPAGVEKCVMAIDSFIPFSSFTLNRSRRLFELRKTHVVTLMSAIADLDYISAVADYFEKYNDPDRLIESQAGSVHIEEKREFPKYVDSPDPMIVGKGVSHINLHHGPRADTPFPYDITLYRPGSTPQIELLLRLGRSGEGTRLRLLASLLTMANAGLPVPGELTLSFIPTPRIFGKFQRGTLQVGEAARDPQLKVLNDILAQTADGKPCLIVMDQILEFIGDSRAEFFSAAYLNYLVRERPWCLAQIGTYFTRLADLPMPEIHATVIAQNPMDYHAYSAHSADGQIEDRLAGFGFPDDFIQEYQQFVRAGTSLADIFKKAQTPQR